MNKSFATFAFIFFAAIGTVLAGQDANPAPPPPPPPGGTHSQHVADPQKQLLHLSRKLALTADQQNQLLPILTDRQQHVTSIESDTTLTPKQRHAKLVAVRSDAESKIRNVLTDTQRTAYDEMKQQERERARTHKQTTTAVQ